MTEFICFLVENQPIYIELQKCRNMTLDMEKKGLLYSATMPKWVTIETFSALQSYLNGQLDASKKYQDSALQRMLWLGDHLQMEAFQETIIKELILDRICIQNCVLFLNEAFKKLKACEESPEIWYEMLNLCMNFTAKNLTIIHKTQDIAKINSKIIEEILERALKYNRKKNPIELLQIIQKVRQTEDIIKIINQQKQMIVEKKLNYTNHPSINWKLSNLSSIINKETQQFKFSDFTWKLVAKMEEKNILKIYLKLEDIDPELNIKIVSLYFQLNLNFTGLGDLKVLNIISQKGNKVELCEFKGQELQKYDQQKLEFTVYMNADQILILCMNYLFNNMSNTYSLELLSQEDQLILLLATPQTQMHQEKSLNLLLEFINQNLINPIDYDKYLGQLNLTLVGNEFLTKCLKSPLRNYVQAELDKRIPMQQRSFSVSKDNQNSSRIIKASTGNKNDRSLELISNSQTRSQSSEKIHSNIPQDMPVNKLQQLKKTPSMSKIDEPTSKIIQTPIHQQPQSLTKKAILDEINIVNFLKIKDPYLVNELNDIIKQFY
ncbi:hypothetical protein pb186bvf_001952 [Paramecium bursaria]